MIREVVLDTETTGLSPRDGHRLVEIGAVELINHLPSGKTFHSYLDPQRDVPSEAEAVHGLSTSFLKGKPLFAAVAGEFLDFLSDSLLIIHNASFDLSFLNAELLAASLPQIDMGQVIDTLALARAKHPMAPNNLDALCKRYGIDLSRRSKHGALLDSELLAEVYLELIGGRQTALGLADPAARSAPVMRSTGPAPLQRRPQPLPSRLTADEITLHLKLVEGLGSSALWLNHLDHDRADSSSEK